MPTAPPHPCASPGCPRLLARGQSRCEAHQKAYWRQRNAERPPGLQQFYNSTRWKKLRDMKKRMTPWCEIEGCTRLAEQVDHIERLVDRPDLALALENLRSLCFSHHSQRTMTDRNRERKQ